MAMMALAVVKAHKAEPAQTEPTATMALMEPLAEPGPTAQTALTATTAPPEPTAAWATWDPQALTARQGLPEPMAQPAQSAAAAAESWAIIALIIGHRGLGGRRRNLRDGPARLAANPATQETQATQGRPLVWGRPLYSTQRGSVSLAPLMVSETAALYTNGLPQKLRALCALCVENPKTPRRLAPSAAG